MSELSQAKDSQEPYTYRDSEWEHGCRCSRCERVFQEGDAMEDSFVAILEGGVPILETLCAECLGT